MDTQQAIDAMARADARICELAASLEAAQKDFEHFTSTSIAVGRFTFRVSAACAAEVNARIAALERALHEAIDIIREWHGPDSWEIYYEHSPEMKRLRAALFPSWPPQ